MPRAMRARRTAAGMSQDCLAARAGVGRRQIRRYEAGRTQPALDVAARIAAAPGITLDQLAGDGPPDLDLSGQWWRRRRGDHLALEAQLVSVRAGPASAYVVRPGPGSATPGPGGHLRRGELRALDRALAGRCAGQGEGAPTAAPFLLVRPGALSAVGRWVGKSGQGRINGGVVALVRTEREATASLRPGHGEVAR